jgi:hypothetical protein
VGALRQVDGWRRDCAIPDNGVTGFVVTQEFAGSELCSRQDVWMFIAESAYRASTGLQQGSDSYKRPRDCAGNREVIPPSILINTFLRPKTARRLKIVFED